MKLHQLRSFQAVCRYGSITKAAEHMYVSQPSVTLSLKELESELGVNLFRRSPSKKLALTSEGEFFLKRVEKILDDIDVLKDEMVDFGGKRNLIKLGMPIQVGAFFLPLLMSNFQKRYPEIKLELVECDSSRIMEMLINEQLDMVIAAADFDESVLELEVLYHTEICFCVHSKNPMAQMQSISLSDAASVPLVLLSPYYYTSRRLSERMRLEGIIPNVRLYTENLHTIKNLVNQSGLGTFLLRESVKYDANIIPISLENPIVATVAMVTKKGRHIYEDSKKMMRFIQEEYEESK